MGALGKEHIGLLTVLAMAIYLVYRFHTYWYSTSVFDVFIDTSLFVLIIGIVVWPIVNSWAKGGELNWITKVLIPAVALCTGILVGGIVLRRHAEFSKESRLRVHYDGDFNETMIDFKNDGTFICDNYCLGSSYTYGKYEVLNTIFILEEMNHSGILDSCRLRIDSVVTEGSRKTRYLVQIDEQEGEMENATKFRVLMGINENQQYE